MDKSVANKKRSPAGVTRRAYSIFGGIINLAQQQQQQQQHHQSPPPKSNVLSPSSPGNGTAAGGTGTTSPDPQGCFTNVYTVTVTNSERPDNTNQVKAYENLVPMKKKGDPSTSTVSSLTPPGNSGGMNSSNSGGGGGSSNNGATSSGGGGGRIGPAPRTLSILTALNELAISDEIEPNPTCSPLTPPVSSTGNNRTTTKSSGGGSGSSIINNGINNVTAIGSSAGSNSNSAIIKSNPTHSSCHYPVRQRNSYGGNTFHHPDQQFLHHHHQQQQQHHYHQLQQQPYNQGKSSTSHNTITSSTSVYHSTSTPGSVRGLYSTSKSGNGSSGVAGANSNIGGVLTQNNVRLTKTYNDQLHSISPPPPPPPTYGNVSVSCSSKFPFSTPISTSSSNTLPLALERTSTTGNKSRESHKESCSRKGVGAGAGGELGVKQHRDRSKSRTPDWIWKIFQLTKHGKLEELQQSLLGLDPTLIRHLADAKGNTVLHCAARGGHVNTLQWLVSVLGSQCTEAALNDHNQAGRTVILTALKKGKLPCLQWLVYHTKCGEKSLVPNEGERSLLHHAATYGNLNAVRWLCSELIDKGICVDIRDAAGMTPLHDAAKSGHITVCHELILAGAEPLSQTELGWRPSDLAIRHRHMECASYFMVAEAAGSLGNQLHSLLLAFNHLRQEHEELRSHFRETLRVGKWLAKERSELIKHFPSKWSQESTANSTTSAVSSPPSLLLGGTNNRTRFSDLEHKLVVAEQAWKKLSKNMDDPATGCPSTGDGILNGEEESFLSNPVSSHDFLQRRLAAVQLRQERSQTSRNSLLSSGSSDENEENSQSSSDDASSGEGDLEQGPSIAAGSAGPAAGMMMTTMMMPMMMMHSPAGNHSSNFPSSLPPQPPLKNSGSSTMRNRPAATATGGTTTNKAAPWLLPPNDAFLSQLSPFVFALGDSSGMGGGVHTRGGKHLPTLDLLHGAPSSPASLLSPLGTSASPAALVAEAMQKLAPGTSTLSATAAPPPTDTTGKNEKSLGQPSLGTAEPPPRHGSSSGNNYAGATTGKRNSTSLDISVLEVIEPTSHASPAVAAVAATAASSFKKSFHPTAPDLICGTQYNNNSSSSSSNRGGRRLSKHGNGMAPPLPPLPPPLPSQSLSLRAASRQRKDFYYSHSEENLVDHHHYLETDGLYEPISSPPRQDDGAPPDRYRQQPQRDGKSITRSSLHHLAQQHVDGTNSRGRLSGNTTFKQSLDTLVDTKASLPREEESLRGNEDCHPTSSQQRGRVSRKQGGNEQQLVSSPPPRSASSLSTSLSARNKCGSGDEEPQSRVLLPGSGSQGRSWSGEVVYGGASKRSIPVSSPPGGGGGLYVKNCGSSSSKTRGVISKNRTPSPKSYVTKLTVMPVEATSETCFPSTFGQEGESTSQQQQPPHCHHLYSDEDQAAVEVHEHHHHHHHHHHDEDDEDDHDEGLQEEEEESSDRLHLPGDNPDELIAFSCQIPSYSVSSSNTPVMPRFNSSGTVVFPSRKPSSSDWHSTELLSLTTPDSSLAGRLSPTPSETSRTESALAPPPSYVSHASQNSEVSKTESARGHHSHSHHHHHLSMNEVSGEEERDLESLAGGAEEDVDDEADNDRALHLPSSFINHHPSNTSCITLSPFQSLPPLPRTHGINSQKPNSCQNINSNNKTCCGNSRDNLASTDMVLEENTSAKAADTMIPPALLADDSFEMGKSDRKKTSNYTSSSNNNINKKDHHHPLSRHQSHLVHTTEEDGDPSSTTSTTVTASPSALTHDVAVDDNNRHDGDNDRSATKQSGGLFEKLHQQTKRVSQTSSSSTTATTRSIRSPLSTTTTTTGGGSGSGSISIKAPQQQQKQHRLPKSHLHHPHHHHHGHHHLRGQSKPWYEIEGSDDEENLLRVATSRSSHSSNFSSHSNNPNNITTNDSSGGGSSSSSSSNNHPDSTPSNPEDSTTSSSNSSSSGRSSSSSPNVTAASEEPRNSNYKCNSNNSGSHSSNGVGGGAGGSFGESGSSGGDGDEVEEKVENQLDDGELVQKVGQSSPERETESQENNPRQQQQNRSHHHHEIVLPNNSSASVTTNKTYNCSKFL